MKQRVIIFLFTIFSLPTIACDVCGCFMGITPYDNQSSINFIYRYRSFNGYNAFNQPNKIFPVQNVSSSQFSDNNSSFDNSSSSTFKWGNPNLQPQHGAGDTSGANVKVFSQSDYEVYNVYELRAKYFLHQRIEVNFIVPLNNVRSAHQTQYINHTGLGDITFFAAYHLIRKIEVEGMQHRLITGAGIKLPVGNYYAIENSERIPLMMQPGTGSIDYFGYFNYIIGCKKLGMSINSMFKLNGKNYYNEKIGNSTANYWSTFYKIPLSSWTLIPSFQFYYEYTKGLTIGNELQLGTSMNVGMLGPGFDVYYKNISLNTSFQYRVFENVAEENMGSAARIVIGLGYNLKQLNYLFEEKNNEPKAGI